MLLFLDIKIAYVNRYEQSTIRKLKMIGIQSYFYKCSYLPIFKILKSNFLHFDT